MNNLSPFKEDTKSTAKYSRLCFARCPRSSNYTCVSKKHLYIFYFIIIIICAMSRKSCTCYLLKHLMFYFFHLVKKHKKKVKSKVLEKHLGFKSTCNICRMPFFKDVYNLH